MGLSDTLNSWFSATQAKTQTSDWGGSPLYEQDQGLSAAQTATPTANNSSFNGGAASAALSVSSAISSVIGAYSSASLARDAYKNQAEIAKINARISETQAQSALMQGQRQEQASRLRTAQLKSTQRASMAANGLDLGSGTPVNVLTSTDVMGEVDANTIHANAVASAWGYRTQGANYLSSAAASEAQAKMSSPGSAAYSSLLTGASQVASSWYRYSRGF